MGIFNETETKIAINQFLEEAPSNRRACGALLRAIVCGSDRSITALQDDHYEAYEQLRFFTFDAATSESELHKRMRRHKYSWGEMEAGCGRKLRVYKRFELMFKTALQKRKEILKKRFVKDDPEMGSEANPLVENRKY